MDAHREKSSGRASDGRKRLGLWLLAISAAATLMVALSFDSVPQPLSYHAFADARKVLGIDNFWNVVSNLPFMIFGVSGIVYVLLARPPGARKSWGVFFAALVLVSMGSAWYHLAPDNPRLLWDRLPIGISMGALFVALLAEHAGLEHERWLIPAVLIGAASVLHWHFTDDLRLYAWVQVWTPIAVLVFLLLFEPLYAGRKWLVVAFLLLILSRTTEYYDIAIFRATREFAGGHAVKQFLAGLAPLAIQIMLMQRKEGDIQSS
ncbi:MAG TPA: ceramidase domain-containing protein [Gammaproteobacteria bacterium]|nr:ceramidase domain-containing protein [Gammaproteobacteria bacterium]